MKKMIIIFICACTDCTATNWLVGGDDRLRPAVEVRPVLFRDAQVIRDDHRRQRPEQLGDDIAAAVGAQPLDAFHNKRPHVGFHRLHLPGCETARDHVAELGLVHLRVLQHQRRIILRPRKFQLTVVNNRDRARRERLMVAGGRPDIGMPG
jgi:hypothetical protein